LAIQLVEFSALSLSPSGGEGHAHVSPLTLSLSPQGERGFLVAQAFQPVLAQAKACGYIFNLSFEPHLQKPNRTVLHKSPFFKGGILNPPQINSDRRTNRF
jgi:hypothetical protein